MPRARNELQMGLSGPSHQSDHRFDRGNGVKAGFLALAVFVLALGLFSWRAVVIFTIPASAPAPTGLSSLVETVTGPGLARIARSENGAVIILIDGPEGTLSTADTARLRDLVSVLYPASAPAIIKQYPFAPGTPKRPDTAALAELSALAILLGLSGWFALTVAGSKRKSVPMLTNAPQPETSALVQRPASIAQPAPSSKSAPEQAAHSALEQAGAIARENPKITAKIIANWLHQKGEPA